MQRPYLVHQVREHGEAAGGESVHHTSVQLISTFPTIVR